MTLLARRSRRHAQTSRSVDDVRELAALLPSYEHVDIRDAIEELADSADEIDSTWICRTAALVIEAFRRVRGIDLYDTQILAGLILCDQPSNGRGYVAEMQTGEGKTFAAAFPAVAFALHGRGVHVATSNKYLAERDAELLRPVFEFLDLSVAALREATDGGTPEDKNKAYQADITYGPGYEFGFDYLRDQLARREASQHRPFHERYRRPGVISRTQRPLFAAVIDEVDHVLLDDASSPLVLAAAGQEHALDAEAHAAARHFILSLTADEFSIERGSVRFSELTCDKAWDVLNEQIATCLKRPWLDYVTQAAHAEYVFRRDVHYVVEDGEAQIIDPSTGRIFAERTWSDGLHQAVETKEGLQVRDGNRTLARITRQRFSGLYQRLCGMTGTASGSENEFRTIYGLEIESVPTRKPSQRTIHHLVACSSSEKRWQAVVDEVAARHATGQPVLVGTTSVSASEEVSQHLTQLGLAHQLLNGRQDGEESRIVSRAGHLGEITVATGIAGRGTDISLGDGVREVGGLHVVVAESQPSSRVERQLVGRAARQGDPGTASRFVSADDPYLARPAPWLAERIRAGAGNVESAVRRVQQRTDVDAARQRIAMWKRDRQRDDLVSRLSD